MTIHDPNDLLAAYALDAVDDEERAQLEQHLAECPRCQAELDLYRGLASALGNSVEAVPDELWSGILTRLFEPLDGGTRPTTTFDRGEGNHRSIGNAAKATPRRTSHWRKAAAASIAIAAVAIIVSFGLSLAHANNQNAQLQGAIGETAHTAVVAALETPGHKLVTLRDASHRELAQFVVLPDGRGYLVSSLLPTLASKQTYQLWGVVSGQPISLGLLGRSPKQVTFTLAGSPRPSQLGINVEPAGGSVVPSAAMLVEGTV